MFLSSMTIPTINYFLKISCCKSLPHLSAYLYRLITAGKVFVLLSAPRLFFLLLMGLQQELSQGRRRDVSLFPILFSPPRRRGVWETCVLGGCRLYPAALGAGAASCLGSGFDPSLPFPPLTPQLQVAELFYRQISLPFLNIFENTALYKFFSCSCCSCLE